MHRAVGTQKKPRPFLTRFDSSTRIHHHLSGHILADENLSVLRKPERGRDADYDFWNYNMAHKLGGNWCAAQCG